jgi:hypothetical protein
MVVRPPFVLFIGFLAMRGHYYVRVGLATQGFAGKAGWQA